MLASLNISNIVLIDSLNLEFGDGLNVLTGETGAGKSILLDALALALGARSDTGLIRHGADNASVIAEFIGNFKGIKPILDELGIDTDGALILRRTLSTDGKSRAWINDIPVSIKSLRQIGDMLAEIHGQFENHGLLDQTTHRGALDESGGYSELIAQTRTAYNTFHSASARLRELTDMLERAAEDRDILEHNEKELRALNPQIGEEEELSARRAQLMDMEKNSAILAEASDLLNKKGQGIDSQIFNAAHVLERIKTDPNPYQSEIDKLYEIGEAISEVVSKIAPTDCDTATLETVEERLFAIRAAARKHRCHADELPAKLIEMQTQIASLDNSDAELKSATTAVKIARQEYDDNASKLTVARTDASKQLRTAILRELPDLKLGQADFSVEITPTSPSANGSDDITFLIKTNPGSPFSPLHKTASGGELSRLMLALRVVMMGDNSATTMIFDELDTGISGATAAAVGSRLARLASGRQALVITHSAQVAGFANRHFKITKHAAADSTKTIVHEITGDDRLHEIARIISGEKITDESIATAKTLIKS